MIAIKREGVRVKITTKYGSVLVPKHELPALIEELSKIVDYSNYKREE